MPTQLAFPLLVALIATALAFDFINGIHDAANSIATVVSTHVLTPGQAVMWAAFFNFIAFMFFGLHVAETVGKGIVEPSVVTPVVIFATLVGATLWNGATWALGLPSSSSHALVGGFVGAGLAKAGLSGVVWSGTIKTAIFIVASPLMGMIIGILMVLLTSWLARRSRASRADRGFRRLQLISAAAYSLGHGANDAQKTMGIIAVLLFSQGLIGPMFNVPFWVVIACQAAMAAGTLVGGWRIVRTLGSRITKLTPHQGFCAESAGAATLFFASFLGIPVSTTHTITGAIVGVGAARRAAAVRWSVARSIVWAWIITLPAAGGVAALIVWTARWLS